MLLLLLLLLSCFSCVRLCATTQMAAHHAPPSLGFSRQEHWNRFPFFLQCMKVKSESEVAQSCPTLCDPMDCSTPGLPIRHPLPEFTGSPLSGLKGVQPPFQFGDRTRDCSPGHAGKEGPQLARTGVIKVTNQFTLK